MAIISRKLDGTLGASTGVMAVEANAKPTEDGPPGGRRKAVPTKVGDKVQNALDETRMLVLGTQVLFGFQLKSAFETRFELLPEFVQGLAVTAIVLLVLTLALLMSPSAFHQLAEAGEASDRVNRFATLMSGVALVPFALALGAACCVGVSPIFGASVAIGFGATIAATALAIWFGLAWALRSTSEKGIEKPMERMAAKTPLADKIREVLTEARVVLPGAQALLGFQLIATLMERFSRQPEWAQLVHVWALVAVAATTIVLMSPAAFHRIVEDGENTERFHRLAGRLLIAAMAILPLGVCADVVVVIHAITHRVGLAVGLGVGLALFSYALWFVLPLARRSGAAERATIVRYPTDPSRPPA